jgi:serine/threonine protein kinase
MAYSARAIPSSLEHSVHHATGTEAPVRISSLIRKSGSRFTISTRWSVHELIGGPIDYSITNRILAKPFLRESEVSEHGFKKMLAMRKIIPENTPKLYGPVRESGGKFVTYAVERVDGITLSKFLESGNRALVPSIIFQLDSISAKFKAAGFEHQDLHSDNILINEASGKVWIIDPGFDVRKNDKAFLDYHREKLLKYQQSRSGYI